MGQILPPLGLCSVHTSGDSFAGSQEKRGSELLGAEEQDPWLEYRSTSHLHLRNHLCTFWNITKMFLPIAGL